MKLPEIKTFHPTESTLEQASKVFEEASELFAASVLCSVGAETKTHVYEEAIDVLQAVVNFLDLELTEAEIEALYRVNLIKNDKPERYGQYMN